jgi:hypothetical protein
MSDCMNSLLNRLSLSLGAALCSFGSLVGTELGIDGHRFTIDGKSAFLLGLSYYGALGAPEASIKQDLDDMQRDGFNWIRVWADWAAFENNISAVESNGSPREPWLGRLRTLIENCDKRGMIVDVTLSRENGVSGPPRLLTLDSHRRAVETLLEELKPLRNWYLDLGNERNIRDKRFVPHDDLRQLRDRAKELDSKRLITASHASSDEDFIGEFAEYLKSTRVDFLSPHRGRFAGTADQTEAITRRYVEKMRELGRVVPIHYQEPFRRGWSGWQPEADDFFRDLHGAIKGGAAGWCFHNGSQRTSPGNIPRRSFDLREKRLYEQLDDVEKAVVRRVQVVLKEAPQK